MASRTPDSVDVPAPADAVALVGILVALGGAVLVAVRLAWLAWQTWAWWSGLVFMVVGLGLFLLAAVGAWLYTTGIPAARRRWHEWRLEVERRKRQRRQEAEQQEGAQEGGD